MNDQTFESDYSRTRRKKKYFEIKTGNNLTNVHEEALDKHVLNSENIARTVWTLESNTKENTKCTFLQARL